MMLHIIGVRVHIEDNRIIPRDHTIVHKNIIMVVKLTGGVLIDDKSIRNEHSCSTLRLRSHESQGELHLCIG